MPHREPHGPWLPSVRLAAVVVGAGAIVYLNSFWGVFLFDDSLFIVENRDIRQLWPTGRSFGRRVVDLSLSLNYVISGLEIWSYHLLNLTVHLLAALALFGVIRRTLSRESSGPDEHASANRLAVAVALIWTLHPLQTESVTYVHQRAESMMGLCYLLTLYP